MEIYKFWITSWTLIAVISVECQEDNNCQRNEVIPPDRKCRKACKSDRDCKSAKKKCVCDGICGLSCFNPDAECPKPEEPKHGTVTFTKLTYGGQLTYDCNEGYILDGQRRRKCRSDRTWSKKAARCKQAVICEKRPERIDHGSVKVDGVEATYSCSTGFQLEGKATRQCKSNGKWSGSPPTCVPSGCPFPSRLSQAFPSVDYEKTKFEVGDKITYKCRFGFTITGNPNATCLSDFKWSSPTFQCLKVSCGEPEKPLNGYFEAKDYLFGTWVTYKCDKGYLLESHLVSRRYCSTSGSWSGKAPTCKIKSCPPPVSPKNGNVEASTYVFNSLATYSCKSGYRLNGSREGRCKDDESWGEIPICEVDIQCSFEDRSRPTCGYSNAGRSQWKRELGQDRIGLPTNSLKYDGDDKRAVLKSPVIPDSKPHCIQFYFKTENKMQTVYELTLEVNGLRVAGASPEGVDVPTGWTGRQATVKTQKESFQFEIIAKGRTIIYLDDVAVVKGECKFPCEKWNPCQNNGKCVNEIEESYCFCSENFEGDYCENEIKCDKPTISNGRVAGEDRLKLGSKVHFGCNAGYELSGASFATCLRNGLDPKPPKCIETISYSGECPNGFTAYGMMCYHIFTTRKTYEKAKETCFKYGSNLATIQSSFVNDFIYKKSPDLPLHYYLWIGLQSFASRKRWVSGFKYRGINGVELDEKLTWQENYCAAYEFNFWKFLKWHVTTRSCATPSMFVCETWKSSAKSYTVFTRQWYRGVYHPMNGLVSSSRKQIYYHLYDGGIVFLYHAYYGDGDKEGWFIGHYDIRAANPGYWYVVSQGSSANYPNKIQSGWRNRGGWQVHMRIEQNNWWTNWSSFRCDVTCGQGMQRRTRRCNNAQPGSLECSGKDVDLKPCIRPICEDDSSIDSQIYKEDTYFFFPERLSWGKAKQRCLKNNMELAIIKNNELSFLLSAKIRTINDRSWDENFWINGRKAGPRVWVYSDGTTEMVLKEDSGVSLWKDGEPNNNGRTIDCVELTAHGGFNDHSCDSERRFICQQAEAKNSCDRNPCRQNRVCIPLTDGYKCNCPAGTVEPHCSPPEPTLAANKQNLGPCSSDPCFGGAKCRLDDSVTGGFICFCKPGWAGKLCDEGANGGMSATQSPGTNGCDPNPCENHGMCVQASQQQSRYSCECPDKYTGQNCEIFSASSGDENTIESASEDPCKPDPCNNAGSCKKNGDVKDGFVCFCKAGRQGKYCETHHECKLESIPKHVALYRVDQLTQFKTSESIMDQDEFELRCAGDDVILGEQNISCRKGEWSRSTKIHCVDKATVCMQDAIASTFEVYFDDGNQVTSFPVSVESGSFLTFKCNKNGISQSTDVSCIGGSWKTAIPQKCVDVSCPDVSAPTNGSMTVNPLESKKPYEPGTRLSFKCDQYYVITGASTITCSDDGSWSSPPSQCKETGCLLFYFDLNPGAFVKDRNSDDDISANPGDEFELTCKNNRKKRKTVTCMGRDTWKPPLNKFTCE